MLRRGLSLPELLLTCAFVGLMLVMLASVLKQFERARLATDLSDQRTQDIRQISRHLQSELRFARQVSRDGPDLVVQLYEDSLLPLRLPDPLPPPRPAYQVKAHLKDVRYHLDPQRKLWLRDGQVVAVAVTAWSVTNTTERDFLCQFRLPGGEWQCLVQREF